MTTQSLLLALAPGLPVALAVLWPVDRLRPWVTAAAPWAAVPALVLAVYPDVVGTTLHAAPVFTGLHLTLDDTGRAFLLLTAGLWVVAGAFARSYHADDPRKESFFGFFLLTMAGNLGLVVAGDLLTFYLFFAGMTFSAYGLVVHRGDREAFRAGRVYIVLALAAEVCILTVLFVLASHGTATSFGPELQSAWTSLHAAGIAAPAALGVVVGFGVKAGLAPLHLWLPLAHPAAPTAASALLSGAMIKAGVLAWLRFLPTGIAMPGVGTALVGLGIGSAFYGVVVGLTQDDPKTVLAYSSVSQMGIVALGVGLLLRSPGWPSVALVAVIFYTLHHGMAKGALFLAVGVADRVPYGPRKTLYRSVLAAAALPALALAGAPLSSGARAKGLLKNALHDLAPDWYAVLHPVLLAVALGTTLLMARFAVTLARRAAGTPRPDEIGSVAPPRLTGLVLPWLALVVAGVAAGAWLPGAIPVPAGVSIPGMLDGAGEAAGPVVLGAALAWALASRPGLMGGLKDLRVPAGDLVVTAERVIDRVASLPWASLSRWDDDAAKGVRRAQTWVEHRAAWVAERDLFLARGAVLGSLLMALAWILGLILSRG